MNSVFPQPVCPQMIAEWGTVGSETLVQNGDEAAILNVELGVHDDEQVNV